MLADPNEVHAWVRATQDAPGLREIFDLCDERIKLMQTPKVTPEQKKRGFTAPEPSNYVHEQQHNQGGAMQPVMTGPAPSGIYTTSTREQAMINNALVEEQAEQGRIPSQKTATVQLDGPTPIEGHPASEAAVAAAVGAGKDPIAAAATARAGSGGGGQGVLPAMATADDEGGDAPASGGRAGGRGSPKEPPEPVPGSGKEGPKVGKHTEGSDKTVNPGHSGPTKK